LPVKFRKLVASISASCIVKFYHSEQRNDWKRKSALGPDWLRTLRVRNKDLDSDSHWHHDVLVIVISFFCRLQLRLRVPISKLKSYLGITDDIQEFLKILGIETYIGFLTGILSLKSFVCLALFSVLGTDYQLIGFQMKTNCVRPFVCHQSNSANRKIQ